MIVTGLISGTSLDGVDVATAEFRLDGDTLRLAPLGHTTVAYPAEVEGLLRGALPPARVTAADWCRLDTLVGQAFAVALAWAPAKADLVASHGQTVFHWVEGTTVRGTLQVGNPAWIAEAAHAPVLSDLRMADVAAGGQGAPLVSLFDALLLPPRERARAALNLGGIANVTVIPPLGPPYAFDTGPANALLDAAVGCDQDGRSAARGRIHQPLLELLLADPYYRLPSPKSTGKEHFSAAYLEATLGRLVQPPPTDDLLATLTALTGITVAGACRNAGVDEVVASGGGTANPTLMAAISQRLPAGCRLRTVDDLGIPSAAKEAYAFAVLGFLSAHGLPGNLPACTGARAPRLLGRLTPGPAGWPPLPHGHAPPRRLEVTSP